MELKNVHPSVLTLKKIYVNNFSFKREEEIKEYEAVVEIKRTSHSDEKNNVIKLELQCTVGDETIGMKLEITLTGVFEFIDGLNDAGRKKMLEQNATAILFPFLRSQIAILTSQPDFTPLVLQPMNVVAMFENQKV